MKRYFLVLLMTVVFGTHAEVAAPVSDIQVKVFANTAIVSIYDFNYRNLIQRQKQTAKMFTGDGWMAFNKALLKSNNLDMVKKHRYTVTSVATAPPKILNQSLKQGKYGWQVEMPVMVVYKNDEYQQVQYLSVTLNIAYDGKLLVREFNATAGKAIPCETTSKDIKVKPPKNAPKDKKNNKVGDDESNPSEKQPQA